MSKEQQIILNILLKKGIAGTFVEIGTWEGAFAESLLRQTQCKKLYCIDPYKFFNDFSYRDCMNLKLHSEAETKYQKTKKRLESIGPSRVEIVRKTSMDAVTEFQDNSLDFVYIDGNHEYKYVLEDILAWYPKVKKGGILAGDDIHSTNVADYTDCNNMLQKFGESKSTWAFFGVYPALKEAERQLGIEFTIEKTQYYHIKT